MKRIVIEFIPQYKQAYATVGNYGETEHNVWFRITEFKDKPAYSIAILLHEIHEFYRNQQLGITVDQVNDFDLGAGKDLDDPGLSPDAPYQKTHLEADCIERMAILLFGENWVEYESAISKLFDKSAI